MTAPVKVVMVVLGILAMGATNGLLPEWLARFVGLMLCISPVWSPDAVSVGAWLRDLEQARGGRR